MIKTAERRMYDLIISAQTKSTGAADAQDELGATVNSLFFNAKSADKEYLTAGIAASKTNADLTNFAYIAAVTTKNPDSIFDEITLEQTAYTTTGYYSLYPAADYKESGNTAAQFRVMTHMALRLAMSTILLTLKMLPTSTNGS